MQRKNRVAGVSERREQSVALFRTVGMDATDRGKPRFLEQDSGLRLALCPLSFLGSLNPFFPLSAGERKEWGRKMVGIDPYKVRCKSVVQWARGEDCLLL